MSAQKPSAAKAASVAAIKREERSRAKAWAAFFAPLVKEWRDADDARMFVTQRQLARDIGIDPTAIRKWLDGTTFASRNACVLVAQWSGHPIVEVCEAAGWNPQEDGGYQTVSAIIDEVRNAADWTDAQKQEMIAKLELTVNPNFMFHPVAQSWAEYIRAVYNQRIPKLAKAERITHFVDMAQADIARSGLPTTDASYRPRITPSDS